MANKIIHGIVNSAIHIPLFFVLNIDTSCKTGPLQIRSDPGIISFYSFFAADSDSFAQNSSGVMLPYASSGSSVEKVSMVF